MDSAHSGSSLSLQGCAYLGLALFVPGFVSMGPLSFSHSAACPGLALPALDFVNMAFSPSLREMSCVEPFTSAAGLACSEFLPFVLDPVHPEFPLFPQGCARAEPALSVLDSVHIGSLLLLQGFACLEPALSVLDSACSGPFLSLQGCSRLGPASSLVDFAHLELLASLRGLACLELSLLVLDFVHSEFPLPPRHFA